MLKFRHIYCKSCGCKLTLQTYTGNTILSPVVDNIECPKCGTESAYSGDDFGTSEGC